MCAPSQLGGGPPEHSGALFARRLLSGPDEIAAALARLAAEDAVSLPLLGPEACAPLVAAAEALSYRQARPVVGEGERQVLQDFEICMNPEPMTPFHDLAKALEDLVARGLARLDPPPLPAPPPLNDLVVQCYPVGSRGITPHRDHLRYRDLVALVNLAGRARFFICADRSGRDAREIPLPPGSVLLMRAPGFAGRSDRPFHMLSEVTETRISLGLRHDVQKVEAAAPS
jgi:hypothetical protein